MSQKHPKAFEFSPQKQALLQSLLAEAEIDSTAEPRITRRSQHEPTIPLSFAQERLWFLNQLEGSTANYNLPGAIRIRGDLDVKALQQSLSEIVNRHEVLRTRFQTVNGSPIQVIEPEIAININLLDLREKEASEQQTALKQQIQQEANSAFELEKAPLIRCRLLQLETQEYVLLVTMHHIVSDGWSIGLFIQELSVLYQAFSQGKPSPLPELSIQYADYAVWQRQRLSGEVLETQLSYWKQQLAGVPGLLQLPSDRPRLSRQTYRGKTQNFSLSADLTQSLQALSRESGTTLFMTLLAAFATLLYRYSGQADIAIGSPIANRHHGDIESLIGCFVNTLVLRTRCEGNPSFKSLLTQVKETTLKAYEYQDVPFGQIVEALRPQRSLSHSPLFQVMFILQNASLAEVELSGLRLNELEQESTTARFDLTLSISETDEGVVGAWEYNTDLFDSSTIARMLGHFQSLLSAIVENPQLKVDEIPLLDEAERHRLLVEWNNTATKYPKDKSIHQLFEEQVDKTPDKVAIVIEKQQLTYKQLNKKANQLAHYLQSLGVSSEILVGICMERSAEMLIALLGILKAGAAYVPIDPTYPKDRISWMLSDSKLFILLTQGELIAKLPTHNAQVVDLNQDLATFTAANQNNLDCEMAATDLAYVIYTSGSTGKPKGVQINRGAVVNFLHTMQSSLQIDSTDVMLAVTTISFDISVLEIFLPLITGAQLVLASREVASDGKQLAQYLTTSGATLMQGTPATWQLLLAAQWQGNAHLKILCGGEALRADLAQALLDKGSSLWNLYGPTETTIWSAIQPVKAPQLNQATVPIGKPIGNTQIYLLDLNQQPVPIGIPGEIHIGGAGLARGYLNRPDLTEAKFIPDPFGDINNDRLYKTGDLARYLADGSIEYLGRLDHQVKIRGFRIELGEIESILNTHPKIQQAVVIAREDIPGNKRLVAYLVSKDHSLSTTQLSEFLKQKLPEYMVSYAFVVLEALPLTPNGKVDRKALPAPDGVINRTQKYVPPQTDTEKHIAAVLQEALQLEKVGIYDNFFELGANSLILVKIHSKLQETLSVEISLVDMFTYPNIKVLSQYIVDFDNSKPLSDLPKIDRKKVKSSIKKRRQLRRKN